MLSGDGKSSLLEGSPLGRCCTQPFSVTPFKNLCIVLHFHEPLDCCLESSGLWFLYRGDLSPPHHNADCLCPLQKSSLFNEDSCGNIERAWVFSELKLLYYDENMKEASLPLFQLFYCLPDFNFVLMHRAKGMLMESAFPVSIHHGYLWKDKYSFMCVFVISMLSKFVF